MHLIALVCVCQQKNLLVECLKYPAKCIIMLAQSFKCIECTVCFAIISSDICRQHVFKFNALSAVVVEYTSNSSAVLLHVQSTDMQCMLWLHKVYNYVCSGQLLLLMLANKQFEI